MPTTITAATIAKARADARPGAGRYEVVDARARGLVLRVKAIAIKRNEFAHGYLTGSINTGELYIESRAQTTPWDPEKVPPFVKECAAVRDELDALWPYVAFGDTPAKVPPGAIPIPD